MYNNKKRQYKLHIANNYNEIFCFKYSNLNIAIGAGINIKVNNIENLDDINTIIVANYKYSIIQLYLIYATEKSKKVKFDFLDDDIINTKNKNLVYSEIDKYINKKFTEIEKPLQVFCISKLSEPESQKWLFIESIKL